MSLRSKLRRASQKFDVPSNIRFGIIHASRGGSFRATTTGASATATSFSSSNTIESKGEVPPQCAACDNPAPSFIMALGKKYHPLCFLCLGCHNVIDPSLPFTYTKVEDTGEKHPLHRSCYMELFGMKCTICKQSIPTDNNGRISYMRHPFFTEEVMCPHHKDKTRRCTGCDRFEPKIGTAFADLGDGDRCVCMSCCRSVILDNADAKPLWDKVLAFLENKLGLPVWEEMKKIPILIVGSETLDMSEAHSHSAHSGSEQIMTRGLCLSEHSRGSRIGLSPSMKFDPWSKSFEQLTVEEEVTYFTIPRASQSSKRSHITAILCLSGLPSDLAASILAHEATHAWIKLHPGYRFDRPIPPQVEEGCCQLVAHLFLQDGLEPPSTEGGNEGGPTDEKLRQYFKFSIETDGNEIYGDGFRKASKAFCALGIDLLLNHIVSYRSFPEV